MASSSSHGGSSAVSVTQKEGSGVNPWSSGQVEASHRDILFVLLHTIR